MSNEKTEKKNSAVVSSTDLKKWLWWRRALMGPFFLFSVFAFFFYLYTVLYYLQLAALARGTRFFCAYVCVCVYVDALEWRRTTRKHAVIAGLRWRR